MAGDNDDAADSRSSSAAIAKTRLEQVASHIRTVAHTPNSSRRRTSRQQSKDNLPADYSDILGQLDALKNIALNPDPQNRGYVRQKQAGKLWVRERIEALLDPGTFREVGSVAGTTQWKKVGEAREEPVEFVPSNNPQGFGKLNGRKVLLTADDFSIRAGHNDGASPLRTHYIEELAVALKLPIIKLVDGSSGGGSVTTIKRDGYAYLPLIKTFATVVKQLNLGIPNLGMVAGPAVGLGAARVTVCHFSVMAADIGSLFNAGPSVIANATFEEGMTLSELGGPSMHCTNGTIDNCAANEEECFEQIRTVLSYLPNCGTQMPPAIPCEEPVDERNESLRTIIPRRRERMYDARKVIVGIVDQGSWFEIGALWGTTTICGLARIGGMPVGIITNNCEVNAGAIDALGSQKLTKHLKFLDVFNIPLVQFVDVPGYAIGTVAERTATMRHGVQLATTYHSTTMPVFNVVTRRCYGVAGGIQIGCRDPKFCVAWPSGEWGSLPLAGGIEVGHAHELRTIEKTKGLEAKKERYRELDEEYRRLMNPVRTANA